jgi:hypothetical protein
MGWTIERSVSQYCDNNDNPNGATLTTEFGKTISNGGRFCDQGKFDMPFQSDFKLAGSTALPYGVGFGAVFQNYPGTERVITWSPPANVFPGGRTQSQTIILSAGLVYQPRYNQLMSTSRRTSVKAQGVHGAANRSMSRTALRSHHERRQSIVARRVQSILKGRIPRVAFQMKF